ncbi:MAG: hypothetical protein ACOYCB_09165 [Fastidiosipilaceae bacterium]|jgi:hypothetical protein
MRGHSIFQKLMTHALTIRRRERDWQGNFKDVASYVEKGFVQYGRKLVTDTKGEEVLASAIVFLPSTSHINPEHEHWMIDQKAPLIRDDMEVIRIDPIDDPRTGKTHHYEVAVR